MRLGALDGLQRALLSLRANWELIPLVWVQTALAGVLAVASLVPFYLVLELEPPAMDATPDESAAWMLETASKIYSQMDSAAFWLAAVSSSAILLALLACYSFFQAGVLGVLTTADRQAPSAAAAQTAWFRTYSWAEFQGRGGQHLWRFFWLMNLVLLLWLAWATLASLALLASGLATGGAGLPAGLAIGCAAVFPLTFLFVVVFFWSLFGQAAIADADVDAWRGLRLGLRVLVRRLGAVALLFVVMMFASVALAMVVLVLSFPLSTGLASSGGLQVVATLALQALQWLVAAVIQLSILGAVVAIFRSERLRATAREAGSAA